MEKIDILGSKINVITMQEVINKTEELIKNNNSYYVCVANVHTVVTGKQDMNFNKITNEAAMAVPDGMPLRWVGKHRGYEKMERCSGPDLMIELFKVSEKKGYSHYFYGGTEETLRLLEQKLKEKYPKLNIVGMYSPPFRELTEEEDRKIVDEINNLNPDIIWVGLGAPKQEIWMYEHLNKISCSIMFGVGAAFNFHAGLIKRAPKWMQKTGLEWLYRLLKEPRRLWKRYLSTNLLFIWYLLKNK